MSTKAQAKTQAKTPSAPAAARSPQPPAAEPGHEAERPDIAAQLEGAARLGHSLGAVGVDSSPPPIIQRQEIPEEEEEELQMKREPAVLQRQEQPEEEQELMMKLDIQRVGAEGGQVPPEVEAAICRARAGGQPLEGALQEQMSASLGHDFSGVRVHTDSEADALNQQLHAKAFTTGSDIFFERGVYDPASSGGQELIAHELTHVVQQSSGRVSGGRSGLTLRPAGDTFEQEADTLARQTTSTRLASEALRSWPHIVQADGIKRAGAKEQERLSGLASVGEAMYGEEEAGEPIYVKQYSEDPKPGYRCIERGDLITGAAAPCVIVGIAGYSDNNVVAYAMAHFDSEADRNAVYNVLTDMKDLVVAGAAGTRSWKVWVSGGNMSAHPNTAKGETTPMWTVVGEELGHLGGVELVGSSLGGLYGLYMTRKWLAHRWVMQVRRY